VWDGVSCRTVYDGRCLELRHVLTLKSERHQPVQKIF
jgi:hypothetical protein